MIRDDRAAYLAEVSRQLWPPPARVSISGATTGGGNETGGATAGGRDGTGGARAAAPAGASTPAPAHPTRVREFVVLPGLRQARLLVPLARRPAATALRQYGKPNSLRARLATKGLSLAFRSGVGPHMLRDRVRVQLPSGAPTIESYLSTALGLEVMVSLWLGSTRANRKPVLQVLTPGGDTIGFAKVGVNELTKTLVKGERDGLCRLEEAELKSLTAPRVLHYGTWQDLTILVQSPLPVWLRGAPLSSSHLEAAMKEVASIDGISRRPLVVSEYWQRLGQSLASADVTDDRSALLAALAALADRAGDVTLSFGAYHGDWAPWNMAMTSRGFFVWDWERFGTGVPLGFDPLHYFLQTSLKSIPDPEAAATECVARAASLVAPLDVAADEAEITALAYLADLATRYLVDRQAEAGAQLGSPGRWLIPAINSRLGKL